MQPGVPYVTLDGSLVTELVRPDRGGSGNVSAAEAVVEPGASTRPHCHAESDEVYFVLGGKGLVTIEANRVLVEPGSATLALAGQRHSVRNVGAEALRLLCICAPPYTHEQTVFED